MKKSCYGCPMFNICNGCRKTIKDYKEKDVVEVHCQKMKQNGIDILTANNLQYIKMTPYENEKVIN